MSPTRRYLLTLAAAANYPPLRIRPAETVRPTEEGWQLFATWGELGDVERAVEQLVRDAEQMAELNEMLGR